MCNKHGNFVFGGAQSSDNPWPTLNCSKSWIPTMYVLLVFTEIDALNTRTSLFERAKS